MIQRILFVDDELRRSSIETVASYLDYYLIDLRETGRFEVEVATNADDAIDLLQQHEFAAAILDVMMPTSEIDGKRHYDSDGGISTGIALACQIHGEWPHLPILILSSMPSSLRKGQNSLFSELVVLVHSTIAFAPRSRTGPRGPFRPDLGVQATRALTELWNALVDSVERIPPSLLLTPQL